MDSDSFDFVRDTHRRFLLLASLFREHIKGHFSLGFIVTVIESDHIRSGDFIVEVQLSL